MLPFQYEVWKAYRDEKSDKAVEIMDKNKNHSKSAEQGDALAQYNRGMARYDGQGLLQDNVYVHV